MKEWFTTGQVAKLLQLSIRKICNMYDEGTLSGQRPGKKGKEGDRRIFARVARRLLLQAKPSPTVGTRRRDVKGVTNLGGSRLCCPIWALTLLQRSRG